MEPLNIYQTDTIAKKKQIHPAALDKEAVSRADRWKVRCGITAQSKPCRHKAGSGKVGAVIMIDFDLTGKDLLEQRLDVSVAIRPMRVDVPPPDYTKHNKNEAPN
jgi:hypothetical protein